MISGRCTSSRTRVEGFDFAAVISLWIGNFCVCDNFFCVRSFFLRSFFLRDLLAVQRGFDVLDIYVYRPECYFNTC